MRALASLGSSAVRSSCGKRVPSMPTGNLVKAYRSFSYTPNKKFMVSHMEFRSDFVCLFTGFLGWLLYTFLSLAAKFWGCESCPRVARQSAVGGLFSISGHSRGQPIDTRISGRPPDCKSVCSSKHPDIDMDNLSKVFFSTACGRHHFPYRLYGRKHPKLALLVGPRASCYMVLAARETTYPPYFPDAGSLATASASAPNLIHPPPTVFHNYYNIVV